MGYNELCSIFWTFPWDGSGPLQGSSRPSKGGSKSRPTEYSQGQWKICFMAKHLRIDTCTFNLVEMCTVKYVYVTTVLTKAESSLSKRVL